MFSTTEKLISRSREYNKKWEADRYSIGVEQPWISRIEFFKGIVDPQADLDKALERPSYSSIFRNEKYRSALKKVESQQKPSFMTGASAVVREQDASEGKKFAGQPIPGKVSNEINSFGKLEPLRQSLDYLYWRYKDRISEGLKDVLRQNLVRVEKED